MPGPGSVNAQGTSTGPLFQAAPDSGPRFPEESARTWPATFRSLRHRNYRRYFFGQLVSLLGSWVQATALMWLTYVLTSESKWVALVSAAQILPTFLFGAWGGALADHWPKRVLILLTQFAYTLLAFALAGLVFFGAAGPWQLLLIAILNGLVQAVDLPARLAFVMDMVGRDDLINAVALNSVLFNVARATGPAFAGWLLLWLGPGACFLINALSYIPLLYGLAHMRIAEVAPAVRAGPANPAHLDGFRYLAGRPVLALLVVLAAVVALCGWPFLSLLPAFAKNALGVEERGYSLMLSGTGFGALGAALLVASYGTWERRRRFLRVGVITLVAALLGLSYAPNLAAGVAWCGLSGFGLILFFATGQSILQLSAGDHNRGRVMGIWAVVLSGAVPLGNLLTGPAADRWGEPLVLRVQGLVCGIAAVILFSLLRSARRTAKSAPAEPSEASGRFV